MKTNQTSIHRPLFEIARDIDSNWKPEIYFGARPYLNAMYSLDRLSDRYGCDTGESVVRYFLANAQTWKGQEARAIKLELNNILKLY